MKGKNRFNVKQLIARTALGTLVVASAFVFAGCGEQLTRIEENQLKLQAMVQTNAQQLAGRLVLIEENQSKAQAAIENVRASAGQNTISIAEVGQEQIKLQETLQKSSEQMAGDMSRLEQDQLEFATKMLTHIGTIADLAGEISTVQQGRLEHEKKMLADIRAIADLAGKISTAQQDQLEHDKKMSADILATAAAVNAIEQRLSKLEGQMGQVQNSTDVMRKGIIAFLKQLGADLSEISAKIGSVGPANDESPPTDPNETEPQE